MRVFFLFLMLYLVLFSCSKKVKTEEARQLTYLDSLGEGLIEMDEGEMMCVFQKVKANPENTFPFNKSEKIEIVSYNHRTNIYENDALINNGKFTVDNIQERVTLTQTQIDTLFSILYNFKVKRKGNVTSVADCYDPHHSIIFHSAGKDIAFLELCFSCLGTRQTVEVDFGEFCDEKWCLLQKFFNNCGIKFGFWGTNCP